MGVAVRKTSYCDNCFIVRSTSPGGGDSSVHDVE